MMNKSLLSALVAATACTAASDAPSSPSAVAGGKGDAPTTTIELVVTGSVSKLDVEVACVESFNSEGESNGTSFFYSSSSYTAVKPLRDAGLTERLAGGDACVTQGGSIPHVTVGQWDSASRIHAAIVNAGGYAEATMLFFDREAIETAFRAELQGALDSL